MKLRKIKSICCLMLCVSLFLTACGADDTSENDVIEIESMVPDGIHITQEREWVYVPEVFTLEDERADYGRMQPVGDAFCYVLLGGDTENSAKSICRYSMTDQELTTVPINWPEGGNDWDVGYRFFTQDQNLYMTANVYPASGSMKRFLCRLDLEENCLFSKDITEQAGSNVSIHGLTVDSQGRLYIFLDNGEILLYASDGDYHGSVSYDSSANQETAQIQGACEGADGRFYVCVSQGSISIPGENEQGTDGIRCTLMELDFENTRLTEAAGNLPNINGLCGGIRRSRDSAEQDGDSTKESDGLDGQYDILLYNDSAVYGYSFDAQKSGSGSLGEVDGQRHQRILCHEPISAGGWQAVRHSGGLDER